MVRSDSPLPAQLSLVLLRYLLNGAAMHTLRSVPGYLSVRLADLLDRYGEQFIRKRVITDEILDKCS